MAQETRIITVTLNPAVDLACTVPHFTAGAVNRVAGSRTDPGGKGVNIAKLLRQFGLPVTATGFLGEENQRIFETLFAEKGIDDAFVRVPGATRVDVKILDPETHVTTDINFPGLSPQPEHMERLLTTLEALCAGAKIVAIAGSVPPGLPPQVVATLATAVKSWGARAVVDTSGPALAYAIGAAPTLIKPNIEELEAYLGRKVQDIPAIVAEARKLLETGIETVVVSLGAQGAVFVEHDAALMTRPPRVAVASTVGAGDAMVAGLIAGMARELPLADRARLATAVSAAVVAQSGPDLPDLSEADRLTTLVEIENITVQGGLRHE
ncbi:MAG: 1-phosphofructokinase [Solidesulfovibrio sp.]